jgi:hypothetical protein
LAQLLREFNGDVTQAVAAYNGGPKRVRTAVYSGLSPDAVTTGGDYSRDVLERKQLVADLMGLSKATSAAAIAIPMGLIALATYNYIILPD